MKMRRIGCAVAALTAVACSDRLTQPVAYAGAGGGGANNDASQPCKDGGWKNYKTTSGDTFRNQGTCVAYAVQGGTLVPIAPPPAPPAIASFVFNGLTLVCDPVPLPATMSFTATYSGGTGTLTNPNGGVSSMPGGSTLSVPPIDGVWVLTVTGPGGTVSSSVTAAGAGTTCAPPP